MIEQKKTYGPVQDGRLMHLAVTGVQQFNPDEEGCPTRWWIKNVKGVAEPQKVWLTTGTEIDDQITHYLTTGENVLGRIARAGQHLLPGAGPGLLVQWGLNNKPREKKSDGRFKNFFPPNESLLWAAGIPFVGFPDLINFRERYLVPSDDTVDQTLSEVDEPHVVEVADTKTTSDFKWAKAGDKLITTTQMNGYGLFALAMNPELAAVRLSHNTFRTDTKLAPAAIKRSALVSASQLKERWQSTVEPIVERMKSVAAETDVTKVEANLNACGNFGGCPRREDGECPKYQTTNPLTRMKMSLLKNRSTNGAAPNGAAAVVTSNVTPWIPPQPPVQAAAVAAPPIMQLPAAPQPPAPPVQAAAILVPPPAVAPAWVPMPASAAIQNKQYYVQGTLTTYLCSTNGKQSFVPATPGSTPILLAYEAEVFGLNTDHPAPVAAAPVPAALPPAPPPPPMVAAPVPGVPAPPAPPAAPTAPERVRLRTNVASEPVPPPMPPAPPQLAAPALQAVPVLVPPPPAPPVAPAPGAAPAKRGRGRPPKVDPAAVTAPGPVPPAPMRVTAPVPAPVAPAPVAGDFTLFVNTIPKEAFIDLTAYVHEAVEDMRAQFGVIDVRVADADSPISFAKWRGVLAGMVREDPPAPGTYVAFTKGSEFAEVVVEALWPLAGGRSARAL